MQFAASRFKKYGVITLDGRFQAQTELAQLAVSHAIAQSTKLCVFESRVTRLAEASTQFLEVRGEVAHGAGQRRDGAEHRRAA